MQCPAREQGQDDDIVREPRIGSWSGEQGIKNQWNAFPKTAKSVANRQTMPRVARCYESSMPWFGGGRVGAPATSCGVAQKSSM
jgi:hypothetical protein